MVAARHRLPALLLALLAAPAVLLHAPTPVHAATSASISIVPVVQKYNLDCEAAALEMALGAVGVNASQDQLLQQFGADTRPPVMSNGVPIEWGDPYQTFVGQVTGSFVVTGYGVYYPPVVKAATADGAAAYGGEAWQPSQLYAAVAAGHPVVVWVPHLLIASSVGQWTAWDGRQIWYSIHDHTQVLIGYDNTAGTVTLADPADGQIHTFSMAVFESRFAVFHSQAVVVSTGGFATSEAISPTNGSVNVAVLGPDHSLYFYWNVGGRWYGPLGVGAANSSFSGPAIVSENDGNFDIAVEGPAHTLYMYWDISGRWFGPLQVGGPGSTYSTPSVVVDQDKHVTVAVQGPANSLYFFWCVAGRWYGPSGIGAPNSTLSTPDLSLVGTGTPTLQALAQSADAALQQYQERSDGSWAGPTAWSGVDAAYSAAASTSSATLYQSVGNSLNESTQGTSTGQVAGPGTTYSAPAVGGFGNETDVAVQGPSHSLDFYTARGRWTGPVGSAAGSAYSAPSIAIEANGNVDVAVEGPSDTLFFFWRIGTNWYGPLQVVGGGSAFSSLP